MLIQSALYAQIGKSIQATRQEKGLTQTDLANLAHISRPSIVNIEKGRQTISVHTLFSIATALGTNIANLLPHPKELAKQDMTIPRTVRDELTSAEKKWIKTKLMELMK